MKTRILLYLFLIISTSVLSQDKVIDSLKSEFKKAKNDIDKTKVLNSLADQYKYSDPTKMAEYGYQALQLAKKINYKVEEGNAYLNIGTSNIILGKYNIALDNFISAKIIFEENNVSSTNKKEIAQGLAKAYGSMGVVFSEQSNYAKALQFYLKSVKIYEELKDEGKCSKIYNNLGVIYKSQNSDFKALEYFIKAQKIQDKINDVNAGITLTNIANIYLKQKSFDKALEYYTLALKALNKNPNPRAFGELYNNMGLYFKEQKKTDEAVLSWKKAATTFQSIDDKFGLADTYIHLGQFYLEKNQLEEALENSNMAIILADEINVLEQKVLSEKLLSDIYSKKGNDNLALEHFQKYSVAKDSLTNEENIRKSVEASMNYEFEKKELLQKEENDKRELLLKEEAKSSNLKLLFGALIMLLLFGIGFLIYNRTQLKKTLTLQKELAEYEQKALHLQMNPHFVFNCLGSISSFIVQNGTDSALKYLAKFSKLMRLTLEYSKESLIPIDKEIESLQNYLELEQLRFNQKFDFEIIKSDEIEDDMALPPLLLQPFVENSIIHGLIPKAEKGKISIHFSLNSNTLSCTIEDTGIGVEKSKEFKENLVSVHKSMALDITKKRLEMMEASTSQKAMVEIIEVKDENGKTQGTRVVLNLPIQYSK